MNRLHPSSPASSTGSAPVDLALPPAPRLAVLLAVQALGLPVFLWLSPLHHAGLAGLACMALAALAAPAAIRLCLRRGPAAPRRLVFTAEAGFRLDLAGGVTETVVPGGRSLIAGPWWVLVLEGARRRHYVVIETARIDPARRAALGRSLRRVAAGPRTPRPALRSGG